MSTDLKALLAEVHEDMPRWVEGFLDSRGLEWRALERGDLWTTEQLPFANLEELKMFLIFADPVHFAECILLESDVHGNPPWRLFDYQKPSMRFEGNKLHQDGAEVGKTREIVALVLHRLLTRTGGQLVGAALDGHLDEIWDEIQTQRALNPWLDSQIDRKGTRVKPYKRLRATNGNVVYFRPAGAEGTAFRGPHVRVAAYLDESAKIPSKEAFANFFRACKPGCQISIYSVPDGRRDTRYYELCQSSPEVDPFSPPAIAAADYGTGTIARRFWRFTWSKRLMPAPWWSAARETEYVEQYGGRDSSAFKQNVDGEHGDPATSVFPWHRFRACVRYLAGYVVVKIRFDAADHMLRIEAARLNRDYRVSERLGADEEAGVAKPLVPFYSDEIAAGDLYAGDLEQRVGAWESLLRTFFAPTGGHLVAGADFGSINDPTELLIGELATPRTDWIGRLQLSGVDYDNQADAIRALDLILEPSYGWGFEATGDGKVVGQILAKRSVRGGSGRERWIDFSDFVMNAKMADRDPETGEESLDDKKRPLKVTYKAYGTRLLVLAMQRVRLGVPFDPDMMIEFPNHQARVLASGHVQYSTTDDHLVEAARVMALRQMVIDLGDLAEAPLEHAVPAGARRDSAALDDFSAGRIGSAFGQTGAKGLFS